MEFSYSSVSAFRFSSSSLNFCWRFSNKILTSLAAAWAILFSNSLQLGTFLDDCEVLFFLSSSMLCRMLLRLAAIISSSFIGPIIIVILIFVIIAPSTIVTTTTSTSFYLMGLKQELNHSFTNG